MTPTETAASTGNSPEHGPAMRCYRAHGQGSGSEARFHASSRRSSAVSLSLSLLIATTANEAPAQSWEGPYYWFGDSPTNLREGNEISHAALVGKPEV